MQRWIDRSSLTEDPLEHGDASAANAIPGLTLPLFAAMIDRIETWKILEGLLFHFDKRRPLMFLAFKAVGLDRFGRLAPAAKVHARSRRQLAVHLDALEKQLDESGGPWILGETFSLADVSWLVLFERLVQADALGVFVRDDLRPACAAYWRRLQAATELSRRDPRPRAPDRRSRHRADPCCEGCESRVANAAGGSVMRAATDFDVAIVGYGPVGAFTALLLAEAGLRVAILERSRDVVVLPRAVGLDGESVRAFQRIGLGETVAALLQPPRERDEVCFTDSKRNKLFGMAIPPTGPMGWRDVSFFDQPELEALLREQVARNARIEVRLGHEVVAIEQAGEAVTLQSKQRDGATSALRASFAIGCDGASSFVRDALGIGWQSLGYDQDWLVIDIVQGPGAELPLHTMQVCDPARLTTYVCVKDPNRRWEFQLVPGETREAMLRPEKIEELLRPWVAPEHYELRRAAVYQFHAATAERWHDGRVFLAGDAAHQTPPFLGQGLNAGFRDAVNLGWKIPLVLAGRCDARLLETYAAERDAHARDLVEWAVAIGKLMETLAAREAGRPDPHPKTDASAGYGQGRSAPPLRGGALVEEQMHGADRVGVLLRQPSGALCRRHRVSLRRAARARLRDRRAQAGRSASRRRGRVGVAATRGAHRESRRSRGRRGRLGSPLRRASRRRAATGSLCVRRGRRRLGSRSAADELGRKLALR